MIEHIRFRLLMLRWELRGLRDGVAMQIAWWLPRWLVYLAVIRVWAHATTSQPEWQHDHPDRIGWGEALRRWEGS